MDGFGGLYRTKLRIGMKETLFISHGDAAIDNEFTKWLSLKLIALGYRVWCDLLFLDKGVDHWAAIESEIRNNTVKFLPVLSVFSNRREGVLKELAVAEKVKRTINDSTFIVPLVIDENLSFDEINIEAVRLNAVDFKKSWAKGLRDILEALEKQKVPRQTPDPNQSNLLYQQIFLHDKVAVPGEEIYRSNWFPIVSFPDELRFHEFGSHHLRNHDFRNSKFPAVPYKYYIATFAWEYDFMDELPQTETYENSKTVRIPITDILSGDIKEPNFIRRTDAKRLVVDLVNQACSKFLQNRGLRDYEMSNKVGYWIEKGNLEKNKFNKIQLLGKNHNNMWHFGISASAKLYPSPVIMLSSHIYFTTNGKDLIDSDSQQHAARRRLGKNWWNDKWRRLLTGFVGYYSEQ